MNSDPDFPPWQSMHLPWPDTGVPEGKAPEVRWLVAGGMLIWEMRCPLPFAALETFPAGGFVEGLWSNDLAECFLLDRRTGCYTEYNLSPRGAWWAAAFTTPRVRAEPQPGERDFGLAVKTDVKEDGWTARMELALPVHRDFALNFTAVVMTPRGPGYFSLAPLGGARPDFHQPGEWLSLD